MTFAEASAFHLTFGKYEGETIDDVAATDDGLSYLDWMRDQAFMERNPLLLEAINTYFDDPAIQKELDAL